MNRPITAKKKDKKTPDVVYVNIEGHLKPISPDELEKAHFSPALAHTSMFGKKVNVEKRSRGAGSAKPTKASTESPITLSDEVSSTERYSSYVSYLKEQDDKEMDHISWSLKRFSKKF